MFMFADNINAAKVAHEVSASAIVETMPVEQDEDLIGEFDANSSDTISLSACHMVSHVIIIISLPVSGTIHLFVTL